MLDYVILTSGFLHIFLGFQVFLSNTNNLHTVILFQEFLLIFQIYLTNWWNYYKYYLFKVCFGRVLWHTNHYRLFNAKSSLYIYIKMYMIWFGWVLWQINHFRLFKAKSSLYIYIKIYMIWFGFIWWHINHCRLFNAKSSLYIHIKYIGFGLVEFDGISTIVGYLKPNPLYTYILNIKDLVWLDLMAYQPL